MKYSSESLFVSSLRRKQRPRKVNFFPKILPRKRCDSITGIRLWNLLFKHDSRRLYSENTTSGSTVSKTLPMPASRDALTTHHCKHVCKITSSTTKESCNPHHCPGFYQGRRRVENRSNSHIQEKFLWVHYVSVSWSKYSLRLLLLTVYKSAQGKKG